MQDPYCLRCQPQVVGACLDQLRHAALVLVREANAVTDNPLVFAGDGGDDGGSISGGNFHAEPVALACDAMAVAIAEVGAIAERRIAMLIDSQRLAPAAVPHRRAGPEHRLHDRPRHRGGAGHREQVARPSGQRRQPADLRQPGRPRLDGDLRGAPAAADDRTTPRTSSASSCWPRRRASSSCARWRSSPPLEAAHALLREALPGDAEDRYLAPDIDAATALVRDGSLATLFRALPALPALWTPA